MIKCAPEEISAMVLQKMKSTAETFLLESPSASLGERIKVYKRILFKSQRRPVWHRLHQRSMQKHRREEVHQAPGGCG